MPNGSDISYLNYIPTEAPPGGGPNSGSNLQSMISALKGGGQQQGQSTMNPFGNFANSFSNPSGILGKGANAMQGGKPDPFAPGGTSSDQPGYISGSGDFMSGGQVIPG